MGVVLGKVRRDWDFAEIPPKVKKEDFHHVVAFAGCLSRADKFIRERVGGTKKTRVVAERVDGKMKFLDVALTLAKAGGLDIPLDDYHLRITDEEKKSGKILQSNAGKMETIDRVIYEAKGGSALLQIADAAAFALRRYFSGQRTGQDFMQTLLGRPLHWNDWQGPISFNAFSTDQAILP